MLAFDLETAARRELVRRALLRAAPRPQRDRPATVRLLPPLTVADSEVDDALSRLSALLS